jgi:UDP-glucose 4-epimerase
MTLSSHGSYSEQYSGARALVLGGTGFLGGAIARRLIDLEAHITLTTTHLITAKQLAVLRGQACIERVDVRDRARLAELIRGQDFLFNFAGLSGAVASNQQPLDDLDVNGGGVLTVVDVCRELNPHVRVIFPGTRLQYGVPQYLPVDEQHPMQPVAIYGVHKLLGEMYHLLYHRNYGLRATVLRISNPYGFSLHQPETDGYNIASRFIRAALDDRPLRVFGTGQQLRDYIHIDDVVEAVLRTAVCDATIGQAYNLGLGSPVRLIDLAETIVRTVGRGRIEHIDWPPNFSQVETGDFSCKIDKLAHALQWRPQIQIQEGIRRSLPNGS